MSKEGGSSQWLLSLKIVDLGMDREALRMRGTRSEVERATEVREVSGNLEVQTVLTRARSSLTTIGFCWLLVQVKR